MHEFIWPYLLPASCQVPILIAKMHYLSFLAIVLSIGCSNTSKTKKPIAGMLDNVAVINYDSCKKWNMPLTFFRLKYLNNYKASFHSGNAYLTLEKHNDSGYIEQGLSFGKCQDIQPEEIEKWTYELDSNFKSFKTYQTKSIGYKKVADMRLFVINSIINFDHLNLPHYRNNYRVLMMLIPTDKQENGVSVSIITNFDSDSLKNSGEMNQILNTLEFIKK